LHNSGPYSNGKSIGKNDGKVLPIQKEGANVILNQNEPEFY